MASDQLAYNAARVITHPVRQWLLDVELCGQGNIPDAGGAIVAANHLSFIDSMLLMYGFGRPVSFLGKVEYMDSFVTRHLFPAVGMIPVDRSGGGLATTLREARSRIANGEIVGIFPEGTRSRNGVPGKAHSGVAHLALATGAPVIPVGIAGTDDALPVGSRVPHRAPISIMVGRPIRPQVSPDGSRSSMRDRLALTERVMESITALSKTAVSSSTRSSFSQRPLLQQAS